MEEAADEGGSDAVATNAFRMGVKGEATDGMSVSKLYSSSMMLISARPDDNIGTKLGVPDQSSHIP
jgi:hypothetical protein